MFSLATFQILPWYSTKIVSNSRKLSQFDIIFLNKADACGKNGTINPYMSSHTYCPDNVGADVSLAVYCVFIALVNLLLLNMLIAIFKWEKIKN